jgi:hypothetical protein
MALTAIERRILECARAYIQSGAQDYVCYAIDKAYVTGAPYTKVVAAKHRLIGYVQKSIRGHSTLASWASVRNGGRWMSIDVQRKARVAWITWMLGEESKLDTQTRREFSIYLNPERAVHSYDRSGHKVF